MAISSGSSYQAPSTKDVTIGKASPIAAEVLLKFPIKIATLAYFSISSNNALILTYRIKASFLSYCDIDKFTTLSGNASIYSPRGTDFLYYSLKSKKNFIGD